MRRPGSRGPRSSLFHRLLKLPPEAFSVPFTTVDLNYKKTRGELTVKLRWTMRAAREL